MKIYKKLLASGVALAAAFSLTACGNDSNGTSGDSSETRTLTVSVDGGTYREFIESIKGDFEEEHGATVEVKTMGMTDQADAISLDGPAGTGPDVFITPFDRVGSLAAQGHISEVTSQPDGIGDDEIKLITFDGTQYGMPFVIETLVAFYNKDLIDSMPATFEELEELANDDTFAFESESGTNTAFLAKWTDFFYSYGLISAYGGYIFGEDGTDTSDIGLNNEGAIEAIEYAQTWFDRWPRGMKDTTSAGDFVTEMFTTGQTAVIIDGPWMASTFEDSDINFGVGEIPTLPNGENYSAFGGGKAWVASSYAEDQELALAWLEFVGNSDNATAFYEATNEIPANTISRDAVPADDELAQAVISNFAGASRMPNIPEMAEIWTGMESMMFDVVSGSDTAEDAANSAVDQIKEAIEQKHG